MAERRRHWRRWLLIAGIVFVVVIGGAATFLYWPRPPTAITEEDALQDFRDQGSGSTTGVGPAAGVYSYDADGTEKISIGPLPLPTRDIPGTVTVVVQTGADGCYRSTLNLMGEHTETTTWCVGADGSLTLQRQDKQEKVPGFNVTAVTTCDPGRVLAADGSETQVRCTLIMDVSGLKLTVELAGTARVEPGEDVDVGGSIVVTRHLALALAATGDLSGHWNEEYWLDEGLLPVRVARDVVLDGPGAFDEKTSLTLRDLQPQT